ncbi:MAG: PrgI family protein [Acidimicrobiia bacterium]
MKVRVPADVDMADRIFAGLTARQLAILGGDALLLVLLYVAVGARVPLPLLGVVALPIALVGLLWATTSADGTTWERIVLSALRHFREPRRRVLAPEGIPPLPDWASGAGDRLAPLGLPVEGTSRDGHVELGAEEVAAICRASSINFALRSESEQRALVDGFARLLNALEARVQFLVRSNRTDLRAFLDAIEEGAPGLPHPGLEAAAREHAAFLRSLASRRDILSRQVLVCFREEGGATEERLSSLDHRVEVAAALLRGLGVRLVRLDGDQTAEVLSAASDPESEPAPTGSRFPDVVEGTW